LSNCSLEINIRLLPYIDFDVIRENPKVFMNYSDVTVSHLFCYKAGISSFYVPAILTDFAKNVAIGEIQPANEWTSERLEWIEENKNRRRTMRENSGCEVLQSSGVSQGHLIGGCIEVLEFAKGTELWPEKKYWENCILFFETSEEKPQCNCIGLKHWYNRVRQVTESM